MHPLIHSLACKTYSGVAITLPPGTSAAFDLAADPVRVMIDGATLLAAKDAVAVALGCRPGEMAAKA